MQATSDKTGSVGFTQTGTTVNEEEGCGEIIYGKDGYNPYYQFGRKDAFRSGEYTAAPAANTSLIYSTESVTVGSTIQNPTTQYNNAGRPYQSSFYYNAWNATYTSYSNATTKEDGLESVVKTVYDPCPVGYTVSPANTFTGFTSSNTTVDGVGCTYTMNGKTLYFSYSGRRVYNSGTLQLVGEYGNAYLSICGAENLARSFCYGYDRFYTSIASGLYPSFVFAIRPVREN